MVESPAELARQDHGIYLTRRTFPRPCDAYPRSDYLEAAAVPCCYSLCIHHDMWVDLINAPMSMTRTHGAMSSMGVRSCVNRRKRHDHFPVRCWKCRGIRGSDQRLEGVVLPGSEAARFPGPAKSNGLARRRSAGLGVMKILRGPSKAHQVWEYTDIKKDHRSSRFL